MALIGLGIGGAVAALAGRRSRALGEIENLDDTERERIGPTKMFDMEQRMRAAGAKGRLSFVGAGGEGFVACDDHGKAFKAGWTGHRAQSGLANEARWFTMASKIQGIKQHVPKFARYNAEEDVLVRECLVPRKNVRRNNTRLWELHQRLTSVMAPYGYGRPEFKNDAYVYTKRGPVLIDAGFAVNRGGQLVKEALALLKQKEIRSHDAEDMGFAIRMERGSTIPEPVANKLLVRLRGRDSNVTL
jgi:hypothetical protein